ncbi:MAG TPA: hypothetical protein V6C69_08440 [Trichormus sp.]
MEKRFFGRTYHKDTMEQRVTRLEKEVFGITKTGPVQGRIIALGSAVMDPNLGTPSKHAKPLQSETPQQAPQQQLAPEQPQQQQSSYQPQQPSQQQSAPPKKAENDVHVDYPAIDRLEKQLLGRTYPSDSLKNRLARMEVKAFGAVSSTDDLSGRREALEQYAKFYNGGTPQMGGAERPQTPPAQPQGSPSYARNPAEERSYSPHGHQRSAYDMYGPQAGSAPRREPAPVRRAAPREAPRRAPAAARVRKPAGNPDSMTPAQLEEWLKKQQN